MPAKIKSPYTQTPYDILSDASNPKVGVITPNSRRAEIRAQYGKMVVARVRAPLDITAALNTLLNVAGRLKCDVFLSTPLTETTGNAEDIADVLEDYRPPSIAEYSLPDWMANLTWLRSEEPRMDIPRKKVQLETQQRYEKPAALPPLLGFEA